MNISNKAVAQVGVPLYPGWAILNTPLLSLFDYGKFQMKDDMKIAFLILAHNQPAHLSRLVNALDFPQFQAYIHLDGKVPLSKFQDHAYPDSTRFITNRFHVVHEGFSLVKAMVELLKEAYKDPSNQYFFFLSGWDYPIKSNEFIYEFLKVNHPKNFISFYPLVGNADYTQNVSKYFLIDEIRSLPRIFQRPLKILMEHAPFHRSFIPGLTPFRGSAWFCISRDAVRFIFDSMQTKFGQEVFHYYRNTFCADEMFFHTLLLNSHLASSCNRYEDLLNPNLRMKNENKAYLHYIDWNQARENPALLDMSDFGKLRATDALFARKFHERKSAKLLDAIDKEIRVYERIPIFQ